jgi:hypothetical protein
MYPALKYESAPEYCRVMGSGIENEEAYLLPHVAEVFTSGSVAEQYLALVGLIRAYAHYGAVDKIIAVTKQLESLDAGEEDCSWTIAIELWKVGAPLHETIKWVRRAEDGILPMRKSAKKEWLLFPLLCIELDLMLATGVDETFLREQLDQVVWLDTIRCTDDRILVSVLKRLKDHPELLPAARPLIAAAESGWSRLVLDHPGEVAILKVLRELDEVRRALPPLELE